MRRILLLLGYIWASFVDMQLTAHKTGLVVYSDAGGVSHEKDSVRAGLRGYWLSVATGGRDVRGSKERHKTGIFSNC